MNPVLNYLSIILVAFVSGTGGWATLQFVINRRGRKAEAARSEAEAEATRENAATERMKVLQEVQRMAQETALASAAASYQRLLQDLENCRNQTAGALLKFGKLQGATEALIDVIDAFVDEIPVAHRAKARQAIRKARAAL